MVLDKAQNFTTFKYRKLGDYSMVWWRKTLLSISGVVLALALGFAVLSVAFDRLTDESNLKPFVIDVAVSRGTSTIDAEAEFNELYNKDFGCGGLIGCVFNPPEEGAAAVMVSRTGNNFFANGVWYSLIFALIAIIAILLSSDDWGGRLLSLGIPAIVAGLGILTRPLAQGVLVRTAPQDTAQFISPLLDSIFSMLTIAYVLILIAGVILTVAGIIVKRKQNAVGTKK